MAFHHLFTDPNSAESELIRRKARRIVRHPGFDNSELEDIEQELALELILKSHRYDSGLSCNRTFFSKVLESKGISMVRARVAAKRDYRRHAGSLNESLCDADGNLEEIGQSIENSAARNHTHQTRRSEQELLEIRMDVEESLSRLPTDLCQLAELLQQMTEYAASRRTGWTRRWVANAVSQLRKRFEAGNLDEYL